MKSWQINAVVYLVSSRYVFQYQSIGLPSWQPIDCIIRVKGNAMPCEIVTVMPIRIVVNL